LPDAISHLFSEKIKGLESNRKQQKQEDGDLLRMGSSHIADGCLCLMPPEVFQDNLAGRNQTDQEDTSWGTVCHLLWQCTFSCLEQNCQEPVTVFWPLVVPQEVTAFSADLPPNLGYELPSAQPWVVQAAQHRARTAAALLRPTWAVESFFLADAHCMPAEWHGATAARGWLHQRPRRHLSCSCYQNRKTCFIHEWLHLEHGDSTHYKFYSEMLCSAHAKEKQQQPELLRGAGTPTVVEHCGRPRSASIYMHLITPWRENGNELAGGLSNERAHGKLSACCFLTLEY